MTEIEILRNEIPNVPDNNIRLRHLKAIERRENAIMFLTEQHDHSVNWADLYPKFHISNSGRESNPTFKYIGQ
jgi:hypothetical protein